MKLLKELRVQSCFTIELFKQPFRVCLNVWKIGLKLFRIILKSF